jgi:ABC-2 type transport system permease protein
MLLKLTILNIKNTFGLSVMRDRIRKRDKIWRPILILLSLLYSFGVLAFLFSKLADALVMTGMQFGQPEIAYTLAIVAIQIVVLVMGLFLVISTFYFSNDLSILVPLPLKPSYIFTGKLATVIINEYLTAALFFVPTVIAYTRFAGGGIGYWLTLVIIFLLLPLLPLAISSALALGMMKVINRRHRDTLMVIGSLLLVIVTLGLNFFIQANLGEDPAALEKLLTSRYGLIETVGSRFPASIWATKAIAQAGTSEGWLNLGLFLAVTALAFLLLMALSEKLFFAGLIGGDEVVRKSKRLSQAQWESKTQQRGVFAALFWREWKLFLRTPIFALNGFLGALIMPIALVMPLLAQGGGQLAEFLAVVQTEPGSTIAALGVAAIIVFLGALNTIASTSISREGKLFYISKMIPVAAETQARAKLTHAFVGTLVSIVPITAAYIIIVKPSILDAIAAILIGLSGSLLGLACGLYIDMRWPRLHWTNPQQAVKQNFNAVIPMFLEMAVLGGSGYLTFKLIAAEWPVHLIYAIFLGLFTSTGLLVFHLTVAAAEKRYHSLDV